MALLSFAIGGVIGAGVGYVGAYLLAPKPGEETQEEIKQQANQFKEEARLQVDKILNEVSKETDQQSNVHQVDNQRLKTPTSTRYFPIKSTSKKRRSL